MTRIFPIDLKAEDITYFNYSNYLNWIDRDIYSLQDYLTYFNPDFHILNENLLAVQSNDWTKSEIKSDDIEVFKTITIDNENTENKKDIYVCFPADLDYKEGIYNPNIDSYICLDKSKFTTPSTSNELNILINDKILIPFAVSQIIFAKKWTHKGIQSDTNDIVKSLNHYLIMAQPKAALYLPQNISNGLEFIYVENGQSTLGTNLFFTIELAPTRYFTTDLEDNKWIQGGIQWSLQNAYWASTTANPILQIQNAAGQVWTNSYPLMHDIYLVQDNIYEDFIFDNDFETNEINIANHSAVLYNINTKNITSQETNTDLWKQIEVLII